MRSLESHPQGAWDNQERTSEPSSFYRRFPQAFSNTLWATGTATSRFARVFSWDNLPPDISRPIGSHHDVCHAAGTDFAEMRLSLAAGVRILWGSYRNVTAPVSAETSGWLPAYHGTWFYGLWSILHHGIFLESTNEGRGRIGWFGRWCGANAGIPNLLAAVISE